MCHTKNQKKFTTFNNKSKSEENPFDECEKGYEQGEKHPETKDGSEISIMETRVVKIRNRKKKGMQKGGRDRCQKMAYT